MTIARVFYFDPNANDKEETTFKMAKNNNRMSEAIYKSMNVFVFPYAFVIKAGEKVFVGSRKVEAGDIIRLYDYKTKTIVNPKHIAYTENSEKNSSAERIGELPELYVSRLHNFYKDNVFMIDPTKNPELEDYHTFDFYAPEIMGVYSFEDFKNIFNG